MTWLAHAPWLYLALLHLHRGAATVSVSLFVLRYVGIECHHPWPQSLFVKRLSMVIDTVLLCAGLSLWALMQHNPWREPWLAVKGGWLLLYIVLGTLALRRARTPMGRRLSAAGALASVGMLVSVALTRQPWGWWGAV